MVKKFILIFCITFLFWEAFAQTKGDCDSFQIMGIFHIEDLCLVTNHQKRTEYHALFSIQRWMHYRSFCTTQRALESIELNDKTITQLLKEKAVFVSITDCYPFLKELMNCTQDSMLIKDIEESYLIHPILNPIEKTELCSDSSYCINRRYDYRRFNTSRFLLVLIDFSSFWQKRPLISYEGHVVVDFWLDTEKTGEKVIVVIPLADNNFALIEDNYHKSYDGTTKFKLQ